MIAPEPNTWIFAILPPRNSCWIGLMKTTAGKTLSLASWMTSSSGRTEAQARREESATAAANDLMRQLSPGFRRVSTCWAAGCSTRKWYAGGAWILGSLPEYHRDIVLLRRPRRAPASVDVVLQQAGQSIDDLRMIRLHVPEFPSIQGQVVELQPRQFGNIPLPGAGLAPAARVGAELQLPPALA